MLKNKLLSAMAGGTETLYVDDVFSTYLYTGNGSTQTINNGIDLAGKGGLVWIKSRGSFSASEAQQPYNFLSDTTKTSRSFLSSNTTNAFNSSLSISSFNSNGFNLDGQADGVALGGRGNLSGIAYASWTFRRAPKFFDCGTYTGNGVAGRQIPHSLGVAPGMVIVKRTDSSTNWAVYHRNLSTSGYGGVLFLNTTADQTLAFGAFRFGNDTNIVAPTSSVFTIGSDNQVNASGSTYVWYAFAHDTSAEGIIQCGSYVGASGNADQLGNLVNLGWEPQYVLVKAIQTGAFGNQPWLIFDSMRGLVVGGTDAVLNPNTSDAETAFDYIEPEPNGFRPKGGARTNEQGYTYIYLAIRRPNKPPTTGTQVYSAIARTGTGAAATVTGVGFAPDTIVSCARDKASDSCEKVWCDRLRGTTGNTLNSANSAAENVQHISSFDMSGVTLTSNSQGNASSNLYVHHFFRRAPNVHDQLAYTGTGANRTVQHNLGVQPELWLVKCRQSGNWRWGSTLIGADKIITMPNPFGAQTGVTAWNSTYPTASVITLGTAGETNGNGGTYVAWLWATFSGISKVFAYTGNGGSQTIDCGFATGARYVLILGTTASTSQPAYVWDTARGIVAGNDNRIDIGSFTNQDTSLDSIDPTNSGFIVNADSSNINVNAATYIGLAFA